MQTNSVIDSFFATAIPEKVWHYTSLAALEGILTSGAVWATEVHFTTDKTEFVYAREVASKFFAQMTATDKVSTLRKDACLGIIREAFDQGMLAQERTEVFVASFSAARDLKSQWYEYADQARGVSIAFDLRNVRPPQGLGSTVTFGPCVYKRDEQESLLDAALSHIGETITDLFAKTGSKEWVTECLAEWRKADMLLGRSFDRKAMDAYYHQALRQELANAQHLSAGQLLRLASHCKDSSFFQEQEWRLALPHLKSTKLTQSELKYRGANDTIPYIAHNLFCKRLPITEVLVGPLCPDKNSVASLLEKHGYACPITTSQIPMRSAETI